MSTEHKVTRFWPKVFQALPVTQSYEFFDDDDQSPAKPANMEQLAKNVEIARAHKVDCEAELLSAQELLTRQVDAYEAEESRRGLKCRK